MRIENLTGRKLQVEVKPRFGGRTTAQAELIDGAAAVCRDVLVASLDGELDDGLVVRLETGRPPDERNFANDGGGVGDGVPLDDSTGDGGGQQGGLQIFNRTDVEVRWQELDAGNVTRNGTAEAFLGLVGVSGSRLTLVLRTAAGGGALLLDVRVEIP